jgi:uncharacterized RDD family membrane protein YckC
VTERLDTLVRVETPEGITLPLRSAGILPRAHAFLIDGLIRIVLLIVAEMLLSFLGGVGGGLFMVYLFLQEWFDPVLFELMPRGATPGKRAAGLRVVMDDGMPVTLQASLLRNLLRVVDFLPLAYAAGVLSMLWRSDFKRLGDVVAGTRVVHDRQVSLHGTPVAAEPHSPVAAMTAEQQAAVVDWALRTPRLTAARAEELAALAASALREGTGTPGQRLLSLAHWAMGRR